MLRVCLQIRGTLKSWTKLWCVLKPGVLLIYKTPKNGQWVGTVLLNACEIIERPSKKDGFCFKLFHPLEQSIWAVKVSVFYFSVVKIFWGSLQSFDSYCYFNSCGPH